MPTLCNENHSGRVEIDVKKYLPRMQARLGVWGATKRRSMSGWHATLRSACSGSKEFRERRRAPRTNLSQSPPMERDDQLALINTHP